VALLHFLYPPSTAEPSCRGKVFGCNPFHPKPTAKNKFYLRMPSWGNFFDSFPRIIWKNFKVNLEQQKILPYSSISVKNIEDLCFLNEFLPKQLGNIRARTKKVLPAILDTCKLCSRFQPLKKTREIYDVINLYIHGKFNVRAWSWNLSLQS
jgi:hypothetical protein